MSENTTRVAVLVGSLRTDSVNRQVAEYLRDHAPEGVTLELVDGLGELPFYNEDIDAGETPAPAQHVRDAVADADGLLLVTPEYNGTMPAVLNNAIDWLSRPYGGGAITGKPVAAIGVTPTPYGGVWSHEHALKSVTIAGGVPLEDVTVSQTSIDVDVLGTEEVIAKLQGAVDAIVAFTPAPAAA
ncbi:NADPH-dependent FMN reductase [Aeromicrobium sp. Leaf350]|uniref:NADPH-dependent FMN reductase n=1 Tax=Aeromicrobium sp. Leaf350 TaxID=2876565 RepID=UPI001E321D3E|nr:NADPH-dependent FMN reductase [Aeromicrobium sp. Leaf350]